MEIDLILMLTLAVAFSATGYGNPVTPVPPQNECVRRLLACKTEYLDPVTSNGRSARAAVLCMATRLTNTCMLNAILEDHCPITPTLMRAVIKLSDNADSICAIARVIGQNPGLAAIKNTNLAAMETPSPDVDV
jgi:hypothetical protein